MSEIIQKNRQFLVKSQYGTYPINNRKTAEQLQKTLTDYENTLQQHHETEQKLDKIQKILIQLQLTNGILTEELHHLKEALQ
jgi:hypothetical protein